MIRLLALTGCLLAVALPARAQMATYCSGALQALAFTTQVTPGLAGRATYSVNLRNASGQARTYQLTVTAPFLGRPSPAPRSRGGAWRPSAG